MPILGIIMPNMGIKKDSHNGILYTKVQKKILKLLFLNENIDYGINEIISLTQSGSGATQRELTKLKNSGIIKVNQLGNQKRYQANKKLSYYSELRSIIIKTFGLTDILAKELNDLLADKIDIAFIYGSIAKQTDTVDSDIDLMLVGKNLSYPDIFQLLLDVEAEIGRKINPTFYSPAEWLKKYKEENNFIRRILEQPKIFIIGNDDELKKLG